MGNDGELVINHRSIAAVVVEQHLSRTVDQLIDLGGRRGDLGRDDPIGDLGVGGSLGGGP